MRYFCQIHIYFEKFNNFKWEKCIFISTFYTESHIFKTKTPEHNLKNIWLKCIAQKVVTLSFIEMQLYHLTYDKFWKKKTSDINALKLWRTQTTPQTVQEKKNLHIWLNYRISCGLRPFYSKSSGIFFKLQKGKMRFLSRFFLSRTNLINLLRFVSEECLFIVKFSRI